MNGTQPLATMRIYRRLLAYARRYAGRLAIGIVAGFLSGGTLIPLFSLSEKVLKPFETEAAAAAPAGGEFSRVTDIARRLGVEAAQADGRMTWQFMLLSLLALPVCALAKSLANYLNHYYMRWVGARVVRDLRDALFDRLQRQSLRFFGKSDVGQLISRCTNDTAVIESVISTTASAVTRAPFEIGFSTAFVIFFSFQKGLLGLVSMAVLVFPLCIVPIVVLGRRVKRHTQRALERVSLLVSRMHENFTGIRVVKAFDMEGAEAERFRHMNGSYFRSLIRALRAELMMTPLMEGVALLLAMAFFVVCYARGVQLSQIVPIGLAAVVAYRPVKQLAQINANLQRGAAALERVFHLLDSDTSLREAPRPVRLTGFTDRIVFDRVSFCYEPDVPVIAEVSIEIPRGTVVALVGETGSGKTTLANLLARFYDPTAGRVLIDGVDLREVEVASLRRLIGIVTQETILFNETVAHNIAYGTPEATPERIREAARMANAHEFITADPAGYERVVGEKGFVLSGGERQRVALARAILKNPPILILDEATSALDTVTERLVQEAIARVMENRTVFAIAHRLSTVRHADQILVVERGRVTERGTHAALFSAGGRYRALCEMQFLDVPRAQGHS